MKEQKGITLIALIITIIVMLILVAVTINMAVNGGLFAKAQTGADRTQAEADKELLMSIVLDSLDNQGNLVEGTLKTLATAQGFTTTDNAFPYTFEKQDTKNRFTVDAIGNVAYVGEGGEQQGSGGSGSTNVYVSTLELPTGVSLVAYNNLTGDLKTAADAGKISAVIEEEISGQTIQAVIPGGFTVSNDDGENTISGGLVVRDGSNNEFVWIPVPNISSMAVETEANSGNYRGVLYNWTTDSTGSTAYSWSSNSTSFREPANLAKGYDSQDAFTTYGGGTYTSTMYQTEFNNMVESVAKYKGFYVGRYETGGFNGSTIVVKAGETGTIDSSSANNSINNVTWHKMYQMQKDFASSNANVASTMIWGCQWDQVMKFVDDKEDGEKNTYDVTTYSSLRHTNSLAPTGNNTNDKVQNIYDLEGNVSEWTLEARTANVRVGRGGGYSNSIYSARRSDGIPKNSDYRIR